MKRLLVLSLLFALPATVNAQKVSIPPAVYGDPGEWILIPVKVDGGQPKWEIPEGLTEPPLWNIFPPEAIKLMTGKVVKARRPGTYVVRAWNAKGDVASDVEACKVVVGESPPVPPGPTPPGPVPPGPTPPVPATGFRVLFVCEKTAKLTAEQTNTWHSIKIADYLNRKCATSNNRPDWRRWDKDIDVTAEVPILRQLWADVKPTLTALPVVVVVADNRATVYPLPATEAATLELLSKIGGP